MVIREGKPMYCDCSCGQIMAIEYANRWVVKAEHHGKNHFLTVYKFLDSSTNKERQRLIEQIAGSTN